MATAMSQFMQEKSAVPSFDRIERISRKLGPLRARRGRLIWMVHYFLWIRDHRDRVAISTEGACNDPSDAMKTRGSHANLAGTQRNGTAFRASMVLRQVSTAVAPLRSP